MLAKFLSIFSRKDAASTGWSALVDSGRETAAGILVSPDIALRCAPVFAGVRVRSETIGSLPASIFKRLPGGGKERADDHPLHDRIHGRANAWTGAPELFMQLEKDATLYGHGYALANRSGEKIVELIRLKSNTVTVEDGSDHEPSYRVALKSGGTKVYPWRDILHIQSVDGLSPIRQCAESIGLCMAMEQHAGRIFGNGGRPSGVLKLKGKINESTLERLKASWHNAHAGERAGHTAILEDGIEFDPLSFNSVDLQFLELRTFQVTDIARALGVPPVLIADYGRATWGNSEQMAQAFLTFGILPRLKMWQGAINRLLSPEEQRTHFAEFTVDELVKADISARFEAYSKAISARILNPNEARAKENLPPYQGGEEFLNPNIEPAGATAPAPRAKPRAVA